MKKQNLFIIFVFSLLSGFLYPLPNSQLLAQHKKPAPLPPTLENAQNLRFILNKGQWDNSIIARASLPSGYLFLKNNALQYSFYDAQTIRTLHNPRKNQLKTASIDSIKAHSFEVLFIGANPQATIETAQPYSEKYNYFLGNNPQEWATNLTPFAEITYKNIYPHIDLHLYEHKHNLKYEFILHPQANPKDIKIQYKHTPKLYIENEQLVIETPLAKIVEKKPFSFQKKAGKNNEISSKFKLQDQVLSFELGQYDASQTLIIDPELIFSTYSGARDDNWGFTATYDVADNLYLGGIMFGGRFPATTGAFQVGFAGNIDVCLMKFSANGNNLLYSTFLGGNNADIPHSLVVDNTQQLVVMGTTGSNNFPSQNAFQNTFAGGAANTTPIAGITFSNGSDIFVTKFNANGNGLIGSTFLGGSANDGLTENSFSVIYNYGDNFRGDVFIDNQNFIYIASLTASTNFPTLNAFKSTISGTHDGILVKMNANLSSMIWGTYYGGNGYDAIYNVKTNATGDIYFCGVTNSNNLPTQIGALHTTFRGTEDGFIAHFDSNGGHVQTTYIGTTSADQTYFIDFDTDGGIYTFGVSLGNYPVANANYVNNNSRQFIHKITANLSQSVRSTVIGSGRTTADISPTAFMINECGNIYLGGWGGGTNIQTGSSTTGLPTTSDAFQRNTDGSDFYFMVLEKDLNSLIYATYFGSNNAQRGDHVDGGTSRFNKKGLIYHAACASCGGDRTGFPTRNAWSSTNNSENCNMAGFKFSLDELTADFKIFNNDKSEEVSFGCTPFTPIFEYTGRGAKSLTWEFLRNNTIISTILNRAEFPFTFTQAGTYTIRLTARNDASCIRQIVLEKQINVFPFTPEVSPNVLICANASTQLLAKAEAGSTFTWSPPDGLNNPNIPNPIATPEKTTVYRVTIRTTDGCEATLPVKVTIDSLTAPNIQIIPISECGKKTRLQLRNNIEADSYFWDMGNGDTFNTKEPPEYVYEIEGRYLVKLTMVLRGCTYIFTRELVAEDNTLPIPNVITPNDDGKNDTFTIPYQDRKVNIFTRWGKRIYTQAIYDNSWGKDVEAGTYFYEAVSPNGAICKGWIQVLK